MQPLPDPFVNNDPRWDSYQPTRDDDLAQPDLTPTTLKQFLRTEAQREIQRSLPPKPAPIPMDNGAPICIPHYR
jgi:hypothetical protein